MASKINIAELGVDFSEVNRAFEAIERRFAEFAHFQSTIFDKLKLPDTTQQNNLKRILLNL